jgi:glycine oxidase
MTVAMTAAAPRHTPAHPDQPPVLILGAGLMGRLLALTLARAGHAVTLCDAQGPDAGGAAARVAAAMLAPLAESAVTEPPVVAMGQYALSRWPQLVASLPQPVFFQQAGTLILWHRQDAPEARRFGQLLAHTTRALPNLPAPQTLDGPAITGLEPSLAQRFHQGLYLPEEGQLDNRQLLAALLQGLVEAGVALRWHTPLTLEQAQASPQAREGWVLDCRGLGAQTDWPAPQALRGVRGEVARLHAPGVNLQRPTRLLHPRYPIYIAPKPGDVYVIGATEIETDDLSPASVRSTLELLSAAYAVHPGFGEARILELNTQCRPTLPNNLPALRSISPRVLQVNGLYRHGFMIAPAVLDAVVQWMHNGSHALADSLGLAFTSEPTAAAA